MNRLDHDIYTYWYIGENIIFIFLLYPSDHYGILGTFKISETGLTIQDNSHKYEFACLPPKEVGFRSFTRV